MAPKKKKKIEPKSLVVFNIIIIKLNIPYTQQTLYTGNICESYYIFHDLLNQFGVV